MSRVEWNPPADVRVSSELSWDEGTQRWRPKNDWILTPEDHELIREGRKCLNCMELFLHPDGTSMAWPERCYLEGCGYEVRERQARDYAAEYIGEVHVGPRSSDSDEIDRMDYEREKRIWTPGSSAWIKE